MYINYNSFIESFAWGRGVRRRRHARHGPYGRFLRPAAVLSSLDGDKRAPLE